MVVARVAVCLKKGVSPGTDVGGPTLLKIGLKVGLCCGSRGEGRARRCHGCDRGRARGQGSPSAFQGTKMGLNMGDAEDIAGATEAGGLAAGVLSIPNRMLCLGLGGRGRQGLRFGGCLS